MKHLCDTSFWLPLAIDSHSKHGLAQTWFETINEPDSLIFCRFTQQSFLRLISDPSIFREASVNNAQAWAGYKALRLDPRIGWLEEPDGIEELWIKYSKLDSHSPKIWMDAYLAAFAVLSNARLVTFDKGFRVYKELDWIDLNQVK